MARKYKRRKRRTTRRKGRKKVYKKGIPRKALHGKVDTKLEKMVVRLAKKEARKVRVSLIHRQFINFGNETEPTFSYYDKGVPVTQAGITYKMLQIRQQPVNVQGPVTSLQGQRSGDQIIVHGITVGLRVEYQPYEGDRLYESNPLHWAVVKWRNKLIPYLDPSQIPPPMPQDQQASPNNQTTVVMMDHRPTVDHLLPLKPWGYSTALDMVYVPINQGSAQPLAENYWNRMGANLRKGTIYRGIVPGRIPDADASPEVYKFTKFIRFKKPMTIKYPPASSTGQTIVGPWQMALVLRSQLPAVDAGTTQQNIGLSPKVCGFFKVHYYNP